MRVVRQLSAGQKVRQKVSPYRPTESHLQPLIKQYWLEGVLISHTTIWLVQRDTKYTLFWNRDLKSWLSSLNRKDSVAMSLGSLAQEKSNLDVPITWLEHIFNATINHNYLSSLIIFPIFSFSNWADTKSVSIARRCVCGCIPVQMCEL